MPKALHPAGIKKTINQYHNSLRLTADKNYFILINHRAKVLDTKTSWISNSVLRRKAAVINVAAPAGEKKRLH